MSGGGAGGMGGGFVGMGGMGGMGGVNPWMLGIVSVGNAWKYELDPTTSPKSIDLVSASGMALRGIYDLSGDRLRIRLGSLRRPRELAADAEGKSALVVLHRVTGGAAGKSAFFVKHFGSGFALGKPHTASAAGGRC